MLILMKLKRKQNDYSAISHGYDKEKNAFDNPVIFLLYLEISNGPGSHSSSLREKLEADAAEPLYSWPFQGSLSRLCQQ